MDVKDKVVLITGASSGIGRSIALNLASRGSKLSLVARRRQALEDLAETITRKGCKAIAVPADVTQQDQVEEAVSKTIEVFGRIDILINNAGLGYFGPLETMSMENFDAVVKTNLHGLLNMTQAVIPYLKESRGMIVNISSSLSKRALPFLSVYAGTKSMVDALSDGMRLELKPYGIKVLNYGPPETETDFHKNTKVGPGLEGAVVRRKLAKSDDVAGRIVKAIIQEKREIMEASFLKIMDFYAPKLLDNIFYKAIVLKFKK